MKDLPISQIDPINYKILVFDLDGTLYNLKKMQSLMRKNILLFLLKNPLKWKEVQAIYHFRKHRKKQKGRYIENLAEAQYQWVSRSTGIPITKVKQYISNWMYELPLPYLSKFRYPGVSEFIHLLESQNFAWTIFSDLELKGKIKALGLPNVDSYSACDPSINALKPNPLGLLRIAEDLNIKTEEILFIGDQVELDGDCAKQANCDFIWIKPEEAKEQYRKLIQVFQ